MGAIARGSNGAVTDYCSAADQFCYITSRISVELTFDNALEEIVGLLNLAISSWAARSNWEDLCAAVRARVILAGRRAGEAAGVVGDELSRVPKRGVYSIEQGDSVCEGYAWRNGGL